jgi:hypothetical protein
MSVSENAEWFVVEGVIGRFEWTAGRENLLERIQKNTRQKNAAVATSAAVVGMYGTMAASAAVAMYDGEYTENCVFEIGDKIFFGRFCGAHKLANGDHVRVVASPSDTDVLILHAVQRLADELVWLPSHVFRGDRAALNASFKTVRRSSFFGVLILLLIVLGDSWLRGPSLTFNQILVYIAAFSVVVPSISMMGEFLPTRIGKEFGETGTKIFELLKFDKPAELDMEYARLVFQSDEEHVDDVYMYRLAIEAQRVGKDIQTK